MKIDIIILFQAVLKTVIPVIAGIIAERLGMFRSDFSKQLSTIILKICQPVLILTSILAVKYSPENLKTGLTVLLACFVAHIILMGIGFATTRRIKDEKERAVANFSVIFTNVGFFGFPLIRAIYGSTGLFWGGFYYIIFNIAMWSYGNYILAKQNKSSKMNVFKIFINAGTVPCFVGLAMYLLRINLYEPVYQSLESIGNVCTPVSMMVIGAMLSRGSWKRLVTTKETWHAVAIKMLFCPIIVGVIVHLLGFNDDITLFTTVMVSLPTAAAAAMFAENHDCAQNTAAQDVGLSTLASIGTVPLTVALVSMIINYI